MTTVRVKEPGDDAAKYCRLSVDAVNDLVLLSFTLGICQFSLISLMANLK